MIARDRGRELQGNYNPLVISELFWVSCKFAFGSAPEVEFTDRRKQQQSRRWETMAEDHIDEIASMCSDFLYDLLENSCAKDVAANLWTMHLDEALKCRQKEASKSLRKIMRVYRDHPINHNHYYTDTVQKIRQQRDEQRMKQAFESATIDERVRDESGDWRTARRTNPGEFLATFRRQTEADMRRFACEEALDCMRSIYKVSDPFTENDARTDICVDR